jgi:hypothetical protein
VVFQFEFLGIEIITNPYLLEPIIVNANRSGPEALIHTVRMTFRTDILIAELDSVRLGPKEKSDMQIGSQKSS